MDRLRSFLSILRKRRWVSVTLLGLAFALLTTWWSVVPRTWSAYQSYQEWRQNQKRIRSAQEWKAQLSRLRQEQRRLRRQLDSLFVSLPEGDRMSIVLKELQTRAAQSGVTLQQVRPQPKVRHETYEELPLEIVVTGRFHPIARLIDRIERSRYLMKVDKIGLRSSEMTRRTLEAKVRLTLVTLRKKGGST